MIYFNQNLVDFISKLVDFNRISTSSFNRNPIFVVRFESDQKKHSNLDSFGFKLLTIPFVSPNRLSLQSNHGFD